jgi:hypothetical protein
VTTQGPAERPALTRGWFHGWCQCGSTALQLVDTWPQLPWLKCADCGRVTSHVLASHYARTDTPNGRHYISYRTMEWPYYLAGASGMRTHYRAIWARIRQFESMGYRPC